MLKDKNIKDLSINPFTEIGLNWMLITAGNSTSSNTMTASWGGVGFMWNKNVAYIVVRPSRYTHSFITKEGYFSLSFLPSKYKKQLNYLGSVSGRDEDKIKNSKLELDYCLIDKHEVPYFKDSNLVYICKTLFIQPYNPSSFLDSKIDVWYKDHDYHDLFIAEILKVKVNE
ncbi:MAG: flavin reductase [Acholeplasmatales bacterium]|jgi:flavin reductase (DIM6/NTAB) family NADH-FMN oxidoreductase RutF|nr:flavin reductase [Acholeplasmatales bacterium]